MKPWVKLFNSGDYVVLVKVVPNEKDDKEADLILQTCVSEGEMCTITLTASVAVMRVAFAEITQEVADDFVAFAQVALAEDDEEKEN